MTIDHARLISAATLTLAALWATPALAGVYVGNPIVVEGIATDGSHLDAATGDLVSASFEICGRSGAWVEAVGTEVDLAEGGISFDIPAAEYCKVVLSYDGALSLDGDANGGWSHVLYGEEFILEPNAGDTAFELVLFEISAADVKLIAAD
jgi:hypothetical protein